MHRSIAGTLTLALAAAAASPAVGPAPKAQPTQRPTAATPPPRGTAPAPGATAAAKPVAAPLTPEQQKAKAADEAKKRQEMDQLLVEWEKQSKTVKSLQVVFERIDRSAKWGDQIYQGQAILKSPDLACLEFKKAIPDANGKPKTKTDATGKPVMEVEKEPFQRIVCTGKEVLQYEWDEKAVYIYPLDKEARQKALQQGPLPFLFNMKAAEAKARYGMTLLAQDKMPNAYLIAIVPREEIDRDSFHHAFVYLNKETFLPDKVLLYPVGDKDTQEFRFSAIFPNKPIDDGYFHPPVNIPGWKINRNEPQVAARPAAGAAAAPGQAAAPAAATATPKRSAAQPAPRGAVRN